MLLVTLSQHIAWGLVTRRHSESAPKVAQFTTFLILVYRHPVLLQPILVVWCGNHLTLVASPNVPAATTVACQQPFDDVAKLRHCSYHYADGDRRQLL